MTNGLAALSEIARIVAPFYLALATLLHWIIARDDTRVGKYNTGLLPPAPPPAAAQPAAPRPPAPPSLLAPSSFWRLLAA